MDGLLIRHALCTPEMTALISENGAWSYRTLAEQAAGWARTLGRHGVQPGDRVAILSANTAAMVAALLGTVQLGAWAVLLNTRLTPAELQRLILLSRPVHVLAQSSLESCIPGASTIEEHEILPCPIEPTRIDPDACGFILFTSGTTGSPKGAVLPLRSLIAAAEASGALLGRGNWQRWLGTLPLFHVGGIAMLWRCLLDGARLILHERFDEGRFLDALECHGITHASLVPTTLARVLERPFPAPQDLRAVLVGGGPSSEELLRKARERGLRALWTYGLTEACSQVATHRPDDRSTTSSGPPLPGVGVRIVDGDRNAVPAGKEGEIEVRSPAIMSGYFDDPEATRAALPGDGWLRTHDMGRIDKHGKLEVLARRTDLVVSGGENIYPAEVEAVLAMHPAVEDVAVVAVSDERWGQVPAACVVARGPLGEEDLRAFARVRLAGFKVPRRVVVMTELPRNAMGKLDRAELRRLVERLP